MPGCYAYNSNTREYANHDHDIIIDVNISFGDKVIELGEFISPEQAYEATEIANKVLLALAQPDSE
jgi:hypothetical protein